MTNHHRQSMRAWLAEREAEGDLVRVGEAVDPVHEIAAYLIEKDGGSPLLFENVAGHEGKVTGNHLTTRARAAAALGVSVGGLQGKLMDALNQVLVRRCQRNQLFEALFHARIFGTQYCDLALEQRNCVTAAVR